MNPIEPRGVQYLEFPRKSRCINAAQNVATVSGKSTNESAWQQAPVHFTLLSILII